MPQVAPTYSYADYLAIEASSELKHEWLAGRVYAMSGGSPEHSALAANIIRMLGNQLSGKPCRVYTSDLRVRVTATGLATHPDVSVVCGGVGPRAYPSRLHTGFPTGAPHRSLYPQ